jgi:cytochrome c2
MFSKVRIALGVTLFFVLAYAVPVFAGGWAVIELDELPTNVVAGEPLTVGFNVLQHGKSPMVGLRPTITATLEKDSKFVVDTVPNGKPGHYTGTFTFPKDGDWNWYIEAFTMTRPMPTLKVTASLAQTRMSSPVQKTRLRVPSTFFLMNFGALGLGLGVVGILAVNRRRTRWNVALTKFSFLVGMACFATGAIPTSKVDAQNNFLLTKQNEASLSQVDLGEQIFVVKGCVTCHVNHKIPPELTGSIVVDMGPNLTTFSADTEYLQKWLSNPSSVIPGTEMPNLNLSHAEIEALIAFINSK